MIQEHEEKEEEEEESGRQVNAKGLVLPADRLVSVVVFPVGER